MDLATALGLLSGLGVVVGLIMLDGGHFGAYASEHAVVVVFGGATAATMIRFPFSVILHGLPMGLRFAFSQRSVKPRELIDELTRIAEVVRAMPPRERRGLVRALTAFTDAGGERAAALEVDSFLA